MNKRFTTWLVVPALALAPVAWAGEDIDERAAMDPTGKVTVSNVSGDIDITTWDEAEVHVTGELGEDSELIFEASGGDVRIEVEFLDRGNRHNYESTDLIIRVPEAASLSVTGVSSDVTIRGSRGEALRAESVSGDVDVMAEVERLDLTSVSGDVMFQGDASRTSVETVSGDVELMGLEGELEVSLVSGDVDLRAGVLSRGRFESVSGSMELEMEVASGGRVSVETMSGDATLMVPSSQSGEFRAQTFSGDISSRFGSPQREEHGPGSRLKHVEGDGDATIRVESFSGDVEIGHK